MGRMDEGAIVKAKKRKCSECANCTPLRKSVESWKLRCEAVTGQLQDMGKRLEASRSLHIAAKDRNVMLDNNLQITLRTLDEVRREKNKEIADLKADVEYWKPIVKEYERRAEMPWWRRRKISASS
jgi:hypothetical protein